MNCLPRPACLLPVSGTLGAEHQGRQGRQGASSGAGRGAHLEMPGSEAAGRGPKALP